MEFQRHAIDELTTAFYSSFTNKNGASPNIKGIYELFIPQGVIIKNSGTIPEIYNLQQFVVPREKLLNEGMLIEFEEEELSHTTEIIGNIGHRLSIYRKSGILAGEAFTAHGVKSIQFIRTPNGWKISSLAWDDEREGLKIQA
ncbi:DUF4440 domain-containing protein [Paenibacillus albiflavus]|uniref:DUF4440 domain-containing protein n=1 Tax=Paenibacillus albiflavus TaxID=2545760 RepID=A0A4R4EEY1_9BACL|nr:DUF4440 domain-containing protein [Paenibacillus albiflavus]TCZ76628.1 DUF4440 domain-containing protein [Paenibacillus albiflavus]